MARFKPFRSILHVVPIISSLFMLILLMMLVLIFLMLMLLLSFPLDIYGHRRLLPQLFSLNLKNVIRSVFAIFEVFFLDDDFVRFEFFFELFVSLARVKTLVKKRIWARLFGHLVPHYCPLDAPVCEFTLRVRVEHVLVDLCRPLE